MQALEAVDHELYFLIICWLIRGETEHAAPMPRIRHGLQLNRRLLLRVLLKLRNFEQLALVDRVRELLVILIEVIGRFIGLHELNIGADSLMGGASRHVTVQLMAGAFLATSALILVIIRCILTIRHRVVIELLDPVSGGVKLP